MPEASLCPFNKKSISSSEEDSLTDKSIDESSFFFATGVLDVVGMSIGEYRFFV